MATRVPPLRETASQERGRQVPDSILTQGLKEIKMLGLSLTSLLLGFVSSVFLVFVFLRQGFAM